MSYLNDIKFTVELASMQGKPHSEFLQDPSSCSRDTSQQIFVKICFFSLVISHTAKITIARMCVLQSS